MRKTNIKKFEKKQEKYRKKVGGENRTKIGKKGEKKLQQKSGEKIGK